jgi:acyl transferase domain-containing protein/acyl carrier protein
MNKQKEKNSSSGLEVAVIGMVGRFPGSKNIDEFWTNLKNGVESISFFSDEELEKAGISPDLINNPDFVKASGALDNEEYFDASFFAYTPGEAKIMNPEIRFFHECAWEALEDAGYNPGSYDGLIGLYAGASSSFYWEGITLLSGKINEVGSFAAESLVSAYFLPTNISYKLHLKGPSYFVKTACSTSLVAIHIACRSVLSGECHMALAGGIRLGPNQKHGYLYEEGMIYSPDGHCRAFSADANGTIGGYGVGVVVLKRLKNAIADRDHIYAVVKGTSINNDGNRKVGYTAPSVSGQVEVIKTALAIANVSPDSIGYIETHGTGTTLGDPIEIEALTHAFNTEKRNYCPIGSIKTNVGHLDSAAGVAGFIKTVLALKNKLIPPSLNYDKPSPQIDFKNSPFYVNNRLMEWKNEGNPLRAGVSSFGIGGTNAHVILEEWCGAPSADALATGHRAKQDYKDRPHRLIFLSARTPTALEQMTENLVAHFKENPGIDLADAAYTLQVGRKAMRHRKLVVSDTVEKAASALSTTSPGEIKTFSTKEENLPVVFMFPGQGAQYVNMGQDLYKTEAVFRKEMDLCFEILKPHMKYDIKEILYPSPVTPHPSPDINQTEITQPLIFVFEYALARLLMKWGIKPGIMIGHSIGEYVAACLAGIFTLEDALKMVVLRGKLMQKIPPGDMLSVSLPEEQLAPLLKEDISLSAVNSPVHCVVSGTQADVHDFAKQLEVKGIKTRMLKTSHAFHSKMMDPVIKEFETKVKTAGIRIKKPEIPFISCLTGERISPDEVVSYQYWAQQLRNTVRFDDGINQLYKKQAALFLEVGPGNALCTFVKENSRTNDDPGHKTVNLVRHPRENVPDDLYLLRKIGDIWLHGKTINWFGFYAGEERRRISLPTYPFERQRYWIEKESLGIDNAMLNETVISNRKPDDAADEPEASGIYLPRPELTTTYVGPDNEIEEILINIYQDFFGVENLGIYDDFYELGGDSLKAMTITAKIHNKLNVRIPVSDFFANGTTIKNLAKCIEGKSKETYISIEPAEEKEYYPLSSVQKRMYVVQQMQKTSKSYNMPTVVVLEGGIDRQGLNDTFQQLVKRHESLRTSFVMIEGEVAQVIHKDIEFTIEYYETGQETVEKIQQKFMRAFDLSRAPLLRVGLIKIDESQHLLMADMHHIISDGVSYEILVNEFSELYSGKNLFPLKTQYKDFTGWENRLRSSGGMSRQKEYWLSIFKKGDISILNIPLDYPRPAVRDIDAGGHVNFSLDNNLYKKIQLLMEKAGVTLSMILIAIYNILMYFYTQQEDIIMGIVITGRSHADLEKMIGMFVNTLPIRNRLHKNMPFIKFLEEVKNSSLSAFENQDYPLDELVIDLGLQGETGRNPLFDVAFNLNNIESSDVEDTDLKIKSYRNEKEFAKFDLTLYAYEGMEAIYLTFRYSTQLFKPSTIENLKQYYIEIIQQVVDNIDIKLDDFAFSNELIIPEQEINWDDGDFKI